MSELPTVMVVDDEKDVQQLYAINLKRLGYVVISAYTGNDAVISYQASLTNGSPIAVVIVDLNIPGNLTGKEVARAIRALNSNAKLIVSSGSSRCPEMLHCQDHGFDAVLEKNFNRVAMQTVIERVLTPQRM